MSLRVTSGCQKDVVTIPTSGPINIPDSASTQVLTDVRSSNIEYIQRLIQNVGANTLYYSINSPCSPQNFNGMLTGTSVVDANGFAAGQQLDCSVSPEAIYVYSVGGTKVVLTIQKRTEIAPGNGGILNRIVGSNIS